ncbi:hypothetical protein [Okeania sp.]|uniref:hypothetical protein n=1 Tax=Okeania sp. TaxID=3100323 RepID=UPI002B4AEE8A|nr:hypothetical protein [Okeania sp.]MEB3342984.1 hypothetical protein [Okeania sp.]
MVFAKPIRFVYSTFNLTLLIVLSLTLVQQPLNAQSEETVEPENSIPIPVEVQPTQPEIESENSTPIPVQPAELTQPENIRPLEPQNSLLSIQGGQNLMTEAENAIAEENYDLASQKLQEARQIFNQLSNFYSQLAGSFSGIDNRVSSGQRGKALETAQMRDQATYQLALVHRAQNQPELAVPLLVQIITSQQPTRDLGKKAYQQLLELGFVDVPYPRSSGNN